MLATAEGTEPYVRRFAEFRADSDFRASSLDIAVVATAPLSRARVGRAEPLPGFAAPVGRAAVRPLDRSAYQHLYWR